MVTVSAADEPGSNTALSAHMKPMREIGFIVIEFNQASGQPSIPSFSDVHGNRREAEEFADKLRAETTAAGRRERYVVVEMTIEDDGC